jgi:hypothetical protein
LRRCGLIRALLDPGSATWAGGVFAAVLGLVMSSGGYPGEFCEPGGRETHCAA